MTIHVQGVTVDAREALATVACDGSLMQAWQQCLQGAAAPFHCSRQPMSAALGELLAFLWLHDHPPGLLRKSWSMP